MPERGGYEPPKEMAPEIKGSASVSAARSPRKFTRRHLFELLGVAGAGAVLGAKIASKIVGDEDKLRSARFTHEVMPIKVSPPEPPYNLPVEPLPSQSRDIDQPRDVSESEGAGVRKKNHKKIKREKNRAQRLKQENRKKKAIQEFWERLRAPWAETVRKELKELAKKIEDEKRKAAVLKLIDEIYNFEDAEVVRTRFGGLTNGKFARDYFTLLLDKSETYARVLVKVADQHGVPLSVMMSVFSIEGAGRQASKNRFQLGPDTARSLGLAVGTAEEEASSPADERTHLEKSAHAAARYLKRLHHAFGNQWGLALSAYNAGADRLTHLIVHYFKNARAVRTGHGPYFAQEYLERLGVNSATLYEKERACLMARDTKRDKKIRFALRPLWYPFAAEALGAHGWRLLEKQQKEKIVARKER